MSPDPRTRPCGFIWGTLVALLLAAAPARADPGLYLSWIDCPLAASSRQSLLGPCLDTAQEELVVSFELPAALDSVIELDAVVDVQSQATLLPA